VQSALNGAGGEAQLAGRPILLGMDMCIDGSNLATGPRVSALAWGLLSKDAKTTLSTYESFNAKFLEPTQVGGDRALWDKRLRTLIVLRQSRAFGVRITVGRAELAKGTRLEAYLQKTAATLAARAIPRI